MSFFYSDNPVETWKYVLHFSGAFLEIKDWECNGFGNTNWQAGKIPQWKDILGYGSFFSCGILVNQWIVFLTYCRSRIWRNWGAPRPLHLASMHLILLSNTNLCNKFWYLIINLFLFIFCKCTPFKLIL